MTRKLLYFFIFLVFNSYAQEEKVLFSEALDLHLKKYNLKVDKALEEGNLDYAKTRLDSLVKNHLQGSYLDPLKFEGYKTYLTSTEDFDKPTLMLTYASWCIPSEGEIPVLNKLAQEYSDIINFVVIYWDKKSVVRKFSKQFDKNIHIVYVDETKNKHMKTVNLLKHALGLSLSFVLSADGQVLDINRRPPNRLNASFQDMVTQNISFISNQIAAIYLDLNLDFKDLPESLATF